jgi:hypothetical protein
MSKHFEPLSQNSKTQHPIDWNSPDQQAMADEELADDEVVSLAGIKDIPRDALRTLLLFIIPSGGVPAKKWRIAQIRLALIAHLASVEGVGGQPLSDLAVELGCTRSLLSLYCLKMVDGLKLDKSRNGKRRETRETYRQNALLSHEKRGHKMKTPPPGIPAN